MPWGEGHIQSNSMNSSDVKWGKAIPKNHGTIIVSPMR